MKTIAVCMIFLICSSLITQAQEITDYELFRRTMQRQDIKKIRQLIAEILIN